jgi:hypothetical protein
MLRYGSNQLLFYATYLYHTINMLNPIYRNINSAWALKTRTHAMHACMHACMHPMRQVIMDGSHRWAKRQGYDTYAGHQAGLGALKRVVALCEAYGIQALTVCAGACVMTESHTLPHIKHTVCGVWACVSITTHHFQCSACKAEGKAE